MKYIQPIIIILLTVFYACDTSTGNSSDPPEAPNLIKKDFYADTSQAEDGTDAVPGIEDRVQIGWNSHPEKKELSAFKIYRSEKNDGTYGYDEIYTVSIENPLNQDTVYIDSELEKEKTYYYFVKAVNKDGKKSANSDTAHYKLLTKADLLLPNDSAVITNLPVVFKWSYNGVNPDEYILRIEAYYGENYHPIQYVGVHQSNYSQSAMEVELEEEWMRNAPSNQTFRWRVDAIGTNRTHEGSESVWREFSINLD
jgi:hypothetical protein